MRAGWLLQVAGACLAWGIVAFTVHAEPVEERLIGVDDEVDVAVQVWPAGGRDLVLWLPSEYGITPRAREAAKAFAGAGIEVWIPDLHGAWFLPTGPHSLESVPTQALLVLIQAALQAGDKRLYLLAGSRGVPQLLRAVRAFQHTAADQQRLGGAVLMHPKIYVTTPQGGEDAVYLPVARAINIPLYLIQTELSSGFWRLPKMLEALQEGGASVYAHVLPDTADGFLTRMDASDDERRVSSDFAPLLSRALALLEWQGPVRLPPPPVPTLAARDVRERGSQLLTPYRGKGRTPILRLDDLDGVTRDLAGLRGKVVLLNFWATWCPPCVEEIPSMQRLYQRLHGQGLEIMAVDVGEEPAQVRGFLRDKAVDFPVLLDPDGSALKTWKIYAFPTSLVVDRGGNIRYAVYGAFAWDADEVVNLMQGLLAE